MPPATSTLMSARISASAIASRRRSPEWSCACKRQPFRWSGVREQHEVGKARRIEVAEILPCERDVRAHERFAVARQLERAAVGGALPPARDPRKRRKASDLHSCDEERRVGEVARLQRT